MEQGAEVLGFASRLHTAAVHVGRAILEGFAMMGGSVPGGSDGYYLPVTQSDGTTTPSLDAIDRTVSDFHRQLGQF